MSSELTREDFAFVVGLFEQKTGIRLGPAKQSLVLSRLLPRMRARGVEAVSSYLALLKQPEEAEERVHLVDQLTTHETFFFREPAHFEVLAAFARAHAAPTPLRVWSAACSTGEEVGSIALTLADAIPGRAWEVVGTDISPDVVRRAQAGVYSLERTKGVAPRLLQNFCLRGVRDAEGTFCLKEPLTQRLKYEVANLLEPQPTLGRFDVIFLRNVLIYFDDERRRRIVRNVVGQLRPGGLLLPGHSETVRDCDLPLVALKPAVYRLEGVAK